MLFAGSIHIVWLEATVSGRRQDYTTPVTMLVSKSSVLADRGGILSMRVERSIFPRREKVAWE